MPTPYGPKGALQPTTALAGGVITKNRAVKRGADSSHVIRGTAASANLGIATDDQDTLERTVPIAHRPGELVLAEIGAAVAVDAKLTSDANGKLITAGVGNPVIAFARDAGTADTQLITVEIAPPGLVG